MLYVEFDEALVSLFLVCYIWSFNITLKFVDIIRVLYMQVLHRNFPCLLECRTHDCHNNETTMFQLKSITEKTKWGEAPSIYTIRDNRLSMSEKALGNECLPDY